MNSARSNAPFGAWVFPIRTSSDQRLVGNSPTLFAATHVLHRLLAPRHPPHALSSLLTQISRPHALGGIVETRDQGQAQALRPADPNALHLRVPHPGESPREAPATTGALSDARLGQGLENFCSQQKLNSTLRILFKERSS